MIDFDLARRIESAEAAAGQAFALAAREANPSGGAAVEKLAGGWALYSGAGSPVNQALGVGLEGPVEAAGFDALEAFFFDRGEPAIYEICPFGDASLLALLGARGYRPVEFSQVLFRSLDDLASDSGPADIAVAQVAPDEAMRWSEIVAQGFFEAGGAPADLVAIMASMATAAGTSAWLATREGATAGGGALSVAQKVALFAGQSTLPEFRCRGVQGALIRAGLAAARAQGADLAAAMTLPGSGSQRNFERAGFRVAYTRLKVERSVPESWRRAS